MFDLEKTKPMMEAIGDRELLSAFLRKGDRNKLEMLLQRHLPRFYLLAFRLTGRSDEAEEAVQNACLGIMRNAASYDAKHPLKPWLTRKLLDAVLDLKRRNARRLERERRGMEQAYWKERMKEDGANSEALDRLAAEGIFQDEARGELAKALALLPEDLQQPIVLYYHDDMTQEEIANILGCTQQAVQKRIERGIARLKTHLVSCGILVGTALGVDAMLKSMPVLQMPASFGAGLSSLLTAGAANVSVSGGTAATVSALQSTANISGGLIVNLKTFIATTIIVSSLCLVGGFGVGKMTAGQNKTAGQNRPLEEEKSNDDLIWKNRYEELETKFSAARKDLAHLNDEAGKWKADFNALKSSEAKWKSRIAKLESDLSASSSSLLGKPGESFVVKEDEFAKLPPQLALIFKKVAEYLDKGEKSYPEILSWADKLIKDPDFQMELQSAMKSPQDEFMTGYVGLKMALERQDKIIDFGVWLLGNPNLVAKYPWISEMLFKLMPIAPSLNSTPEFRDKLADLFIKMMDGKDIGVNWISIVPTTFPHKKFGPLVRQALEKNPKMLGEWRMSELSAQLDELGIDRDWWRDLVVDQIEEALKDKDLRSVDGYLRTLANLRDEDSWSLLEAYVEKAFETGKSDSNIIYEFNRIDLKRSVQLMGKVMESRNAVVQEMMVENTRWLLRNLPKDKQLEIVDYWKTLISDKELQSQLDQIKKILSERGHSME